MHNTDQDWRKRHKTKKTQNPRDKETNIKLLQTGRQKRIRRRQKERRNTEKQK
jgi:hypothetical protein